MKPNLINLINLIKLNMMLKIKETFEIINLLFYFTEPFSEQVLIFGKICW